MDQAMCDHSIEPPAIQFRRGDIAAVELPQVPELSPCGIDVTGREVIPEIVRLRHQPQHLARPTTDVENPHSRLWREVAHEPCLAIRLADRGLEEPIDPRVGQNRMDSSSRLGHGSYPRRDLNPGRGLL